MCDACGYDKEQVVKLASFRGKLRVFVRGHTERVQALPRRDEPQAAPIRRQAIRL